MYYIFRYQKFLCTPWSLALGKNSYNNIKNNRTQVPDYVISYGYAPIYLVKQKWNKS